MDADTLTNRTQSYHRNPSNGESGVVPRSMPREEVPEGSCKPPPGKRKPDGEGDRIQLRRCNKTEGTGPRNLSRRSRSRDPDKSTLFGPLRQRWDLTGVVTTGRIEVGATRSLHSVTGVMKEAPFRGTSSLEQCEPGKSHWLLPDATRARRAAQTPSGDPRSL